MKTVYVLLVNWNGWADTVECLESLLRLDYPDYRVVVCDNGSTDDSVERIVDWAEGRMSVPQSAAQAAYSDLTTPPPDKPVACTVYDRRQAESGGDLCCVSKLTLIRTGENLGFAGGNNVGLRYALARNDFDYVWLLNNDTVVEPSALSALVQRLHEKRSAGICGSTLLHYSRPERVQARGGGWYCKWIGLPWHIGQLGKADSYPRMELVERWMNYVVGASMLVSRDFLEKAGLMCEDYFLYFEEVDWIRRAAPCFSLAYAPDSIVYHKVGGSIGTRSDPRHKSALCDYFALRNRLLFTRRHCPEALPAIYVSLACALLIRLALGRFDLARVAWKILLGKEISPPSHGVEA